MENKCGCEEKCGENKCGMFVSGCNYKHKILKKLLMLIVLIIIFNLGVRIGELKGMLKMNMHYSHNAVMGNDYGYPMMGVGYN